MLRHLSAPGGPWPAPWIGSLPSVLIPVPVLPRLGVISS